MRPRFLISIAILVLAILAIVFWLRPVRPSANSEPTSMAQPTNNVPATPVTPASAASQSVPGTSPAIITPATPKPSTANRIGTAEVVATFVEGKNVPVEFYGLVIDQDSNALAGVDVKVSVQQLTTPNPAAMELGTTEVPFERTTGPDGRFEISGLTGESLDLASIQKDGYEAEPTKRGFGSSSGSFDNPVIFKMWSTNIHEQLITGEKKFTIVPDGRPYVIDLSKGTIAESGAGDLKVWIKRPDPIAYGKKYDWTCGVDAINGGGILQETDASASMYQAPADGYTTSFSYEEDAGVNGWGDTTGAQRFYVRLNNGQEYGRISIELEAYYNDQIPGMIRLSYAINPSGSRVLR
jgi:hypothetical protein